MSAILDLWQTWPTASAFGLPDDKTEAEREVLKIVELWRRRSVNGLDGAIMAWSRSTGTSRDDYRHEVRMAIKSYRRVMPFCRQMWRAAHGAATTGVEVKSCTP